MNNNYLKYILYLKILIFLFIKYFSVKSFPINDTYSNIIIGPEDSNFISSYVNKYGQLFVETFSNKKSNKRYIYSLISNGREYFENSIKEITLENSLLNIKNMNSIVLGSEKNQLLLNILYGVNNNYFELLNISSDSNNNNYFKPNEDLMNFKILSNTNSLLRLSNSIFLFSYYTHSKYLNALRFSVTYISNTFRFIYKYNNTFSVYDIFNSTTCFETTNYINCLYFTSHLLSYKFQVAIIDINSEDLLCYGTCIIDTSSESYESNIFRKGIHLEDEICAYIFFPNSGTKPKFTIQNFVREKSTKNSYLSYIINLIELSEVEDLDNNCDLNDIIRINSSRFAFISTTINRIKNIILLFDLYNDNNSLMMRIYSLNLEGKKTSSNLRLFLFLGFIGFSSCYKKEKEQCSFSILSYGNTKDYSKVDDFLMKLDLNQNYNHLYLEENIVIENNYLDMSK